MIGVRAAIDKNHPVLAKETVCRTKIAKACEIKCAGRLAFEMCQHGSGAVELDQAFPAVRGDRPDQPGGTCRRIKREAPRFESSTIDTLHFRQQ